MLSIAQFDDDFFCLKETKTSIDLMTKSNELKVTYKSYNSSYELKNDIDNNIFPYDYLILDVYDKIPDCNNEKNIVQVILNSLNVMDSNTKVLLFTKGSTSTGTVYELKFDISTYPNLLTENIFHKDNIDNMVNYLINDYLKNNISEKFGYLNEDDYLLKAEINSIGFSSVSLVIMNIIKNKNINDKILVERMSSGFSGASVFKLHYNKKVSILKVSKDKKKLANEISNAEKYYIELPYQFKINISNTDYSTKDIGAFMIENVPEGITLFDFLLQTIDKNKVEDFFNKLFTNNNSMKSFYANNTVKEEKYKAINVKFDEIHRSKIKLALVELKPLLVWDDKNGNILLDYLKSSIFDNIRPEVITKLNKIVICHGDFHSKNIMKSNENIAIIDPGCMKEDFWCMDICRLLVNLFIEGFDYKTKEYYDINIIHNQVELAKCIITLKELENGSKNSGFIYAVNWIISNVKEIYGEMFCEWEFQLGLLREFIQIAYRANSTPPNKRAIATLAAYECLMSANENLNNE